MTRDIMLERRTSKIVFGLLVIMLVLCAWLGTGVKRVYAEDYFCSIQGTEECTVELKDGETVYYTWPVNWTVDQDFGFQVGKLATTLCGSEEFTEHIRPIDNQPSTYGYYCLGWKDGDYMRLLETEGESMKIRMYARKGP